MEYGVRSTPFSLFAQKDAHEALLRMNLCRLARPNRLLSSLVMLVAIFPGGKEDSSPGTQASLGSDHVQPWRGISNGGVNVWFVPEPSSLANWRTVVGRVVSIRLLKVTIDPTQVPITGYSICIKSHFSVCYW
jgi:hypothetical protein